MGMGNFRKGSTNQTVRRSKTGRKKMGRNGKDECDESSEVNLIDRKAKIVTQKPRESDKRGGTWVTKLVRAKKKRGRKRERAMRCEILTCSPN